MAPQTQTLVVILAMTAIAIGSWLTRSRLPFKPSRSLQPRFDSAPFAIDTQTGEVHIKDFALVLRSGMSKSEFLDSKLYSRTQKASLYPLANGLGHRFLTVWNDAAFEQVYLRLDFENDRLGWIDFGWGPKITTTEWTKERVESDVQRYRAFMIAQLGSLGEFTWGRAYAVRDDKAGAPIMGIRYRGFEFPAKTNPSTARA